MGRLLLGIDVGTTATKAVLVDTAGGVLAEASAETRLSSPRPGWAEEDPEEWWRNLRDLLVPQLFGSCEASDRGLAAVGVSGMVPTLVCLDDNGDPLRPSIQQNDARAVDEIDELRSELAETDVLGRTGSAITQQSIGPKVLWLGRNEPEVLDRTTSVCGSYDFIVRRLSGNGRSAEANWALESGLYDLRTEAWAEDICAASGVDQHWLGEVRRPSEVVGETRGVGTGLPAGVPVVAGCADHVASAFSAGLVEEGDLLVKLGGAADVLLTSATPVTDERLFLDYHPVPGKFLPNGCMAASGSVIRWFQEELAGNTPLEALDREAEEAGIGAGGIVALPYFLGEKTPINDPRARGVFVGLHLGHRRGHLFRAILESIAFGFAHHVEVLGELGLVPRRVRVTNGGSRSKLWKRIVADVLGLPMESIVRHPGSSLGAAFVSGMGVGEFEDWSEIERFVEVDERIEPDEENHRRYRELYGVYRSLYPALKEQQHALAGFDAAREDL